MSDISKIKLPNNVTYDLKDNGAVRVDDLKSKGSSCQPVYFDNDGNALPISSGVILATKNYNGFVASGNADPSGWYYFANIKPINNYDIWHVKYKVYMEVPMNSVNASTYMHYKYDGIVEFYGRQQDILTQFIFNNIANSSYRPFYNHVVNKALTAKASTVGHLLGFRFQTSANPNNVNYARNIKIELLEYNKCEFTFFDTMLLYSEVPNTGSSNYYQRTEYNGTSNGLQETGDSDTYVHNCMSNSYLKNNNNFRLSTYPLFGLNRNDETMGISLYSSEYTGNTNGVNTARVYNTYGFDYTKGLFFHWSNVNTAKSGNVNQHIFYDYSGFDIRYSDNAWYSYNPNNFGMRARMPVYLRGVIKEDGLFYLRPFDATQIVVDGYYKNSTTFVTTNGGSTNISTYTSLNANVTYRDIKTGTYYAYNSTAKTYSVTTDYSSKPAYQKVWTQDIPEAIEYDDAGYRYVYWFIGIPYYNGSYIDGQYQLDLYPINKIYWYNNGIVEEYVSNSMTRLTAARNLFINTYSPVTYPISNRIKLLYSAQNTTVRGSISTVSHGIKTTAISSNWISILFGSEDYHKSSMMCFENGKTYTITADVSGIVCSADTSETTTRYILLRIAHTTESSPNSFSTIYSKNVISYTPSERGTIKSGKLNFTFTIPDDTTSIYMRFQPSSTSSSLSTANVDYIEVKNLMLVEGTSPSSWSPAPEDAALMVDTASVYNYTDITSSMGSHTQDFISVLARYCGNGTSNTDSTYCYNIRALCVVEIENTHPTVDSSFIFNLINGQTPWDFTCELVKTYSDTAGGGNQIFQSPDISLRSYPAENRVAVEGMWNNVVDGSSAYSWCAQVSFYIMTSEPLF